MRRPLGAFLIILGCVIFVLEVPSIDGVLLSLSHSHGIHLSDLIGGAAILSGITSLWRGPPLTR